MAQVKIYGLESTLQALRTSLSDTIHACMMDVLKLPESKRFHRFIGLKTEDFIYPNDRSSNYIIIEISMFEGRLAETKKALIYRLMEAISAECRISKQDIEITLFESAPGNWGIRGKTGDELMVGYRIDV